MNMESLLRRGIKIFAFITAMNFLSYALVGLLVYKFVYVDYFKDQTTKEEAASIAENIDLLANFERLYSNKFVANLGLNNNELNHSFEEKNKPTQICEKLTSTEIISYVRNPNYILDDMVNSVSHEKSYLNYDIIQLFAGKNSQCDSRRMSILRDKEGNVLSMYIYNNAFEGSNKSNSFFGDRTFYNKIDENFISATSRGDKIKYYLDRKTGNYLHENKGGINIYTKKYFEDIARLIADLNLPDAKKDIIASMYSATDDNTIYIFNALSKKNIIREDDIFAKNKLLLLMSFEEYLKKYYYKRGDKLEYVAFDIKEEFMKINNKYSLGYKVESSDVFRTNTSLYREYDDLEKIKIFFRLGHKISKWINKDI